MNDHILKTPKYNIVIDEFADSRNRQYLTIITYKDKTYLTIIDNVIGGQLIAFVLDIAEAEGVNLKWFIKIVNLWYYENSDKYPLSFEFTKNDSYNKVSKMIKTFNLSDISQISGRVFSYNMSDKIQVKKKRVQRAKSLDTVNLRRRRIQVSN